MPQVINPQNVHVATTLKYSAPLISCLYHPQGDYLFAGCQDRKILRWRIADNSQTELTHHDSWVKSLIFIRGGHELVSGGYDGLIVWWAALDQQPEPLRSVQAHQGWIRAMATSPDQKILASCGHDQAVILWDAETGKRLHILRGHERPIYNLRFHPDGRHLISGDLQAKFIVWDLQTLQKAREFKIEALSKFDSGFQAEYGGPYTMFFSPDGRKLFAGGITNVTNAFAGIGNPLLVQLDWTSGNVLHSHVSKDKLNGKVWSAALHPESFIIGAVGGQAGGLLFFWKLDQAEEFHSYNLGNAVRDLSLAPDGIHLATAHYDGQIRICKISSPS